MRYAVELTPDEEGEAVLVAVPDLPMVHTFGDTEAEARIMAVDAIETVLDYFIENWQPIPMPSAIGNRASVALPIRTAGKIAIYSALLDGDVSRAGLAMRLGWPDRRLIGLLDLFADSSMDDIEAALRALGYEASIDVRPVAA